MSVDRGSMPEGTGERHVSRRDRLIATVVPGLLLVVALHQVFLATTADLTPWKGGGFGMFASSDHLDTRILHVHVGTDRGFFPVSREGVNELSARGGARRAYVRLRAMPTRTHAENWLTYLEDVPWRLDGDVARPGLVNGKDGAGGIDELEVHVIRTTVWRPKPDRPTGQMVPERVASYELPIGQEP